MIIQDVTPDFFAFWQEARTAPADAQARLWRDRYEEPHRLLFDLSERRLGTPEVLPAALARFDADVSRMQEMLPEVRWLAGQIVPALTSHFALETLNLPWILAVGMYWSDGWVMEWDGVPTAVLAIEMLESAQQAHLLMVHEAAHVAHDAALGTAWDGLQTLADGLFLEGLAVFSAAQLLPGHDEATYLWAGRAQTHRGEPVSDWLERCEAALPALVAELRSSLTITDATQISRYFYGETDSPWPARIGYFVGYRFLQQLATEYSLADLARWPSARIAQEIAQLM